MLTAVGGCHLSRNQGLPDPADARTTLASMEVLAVDAARRDGRHVCQSSSRPLYGFDGVMRFLQSRQNAGLAANGTKTFALRPTADTLADLSRPIDPRHLKTRKQGTATLTYCPWNTIARHLHHRAPGWCWEVQSVQEVGGSVVVTGRLTIPTADGDLLHYSAVASEPLESASKAPAAEVAASSCLRRAAALAGLGLELWG